MTPPKNEREKNYLREEPTGPEIIAIVVFALICTAWAIHIAWDAYVRTPDIVDFRHFVHPEQTKFEGKAMFLFAPLFFMVLGLIGVGALLTRRGRDRARADSSFTRASLLFLLVFFLFCLWGTNEQASNALQAISHMEQNTRR